MDQAVKIRWRGGGEMPWNFRVIRENGKLLTLCVFGQSQSFLNTSLVFIRHNYELLVVLILDRMMYPDQICLSYTIYCAFKLSLDYYATCLHYSLQ